MTHAPAAPRRVPAVSVVIPARNAATTIAETLASLQSQRFAEWEAVVVDDGSTDETSAVVSAMAESDQRISIVRQEPAGAAAARNRGLALIKHRWVLFLDADDGILPEHLERLSAVLDSSPEADAAVCGWTLVRAGRAIESEYCHGEGDLFPILARRPAFAIHTCLIDRVRVDAAGGFDVRWNVHQDWRLWQRVARAGARFAVIRDPLAVYRLHEGTITGDQSRFAAQALVVIALGHAPDPAVRNPHPLHADGRPIHELADAQVTHLAWPAGIEIARGVDACRLFEEVAYGVALGAAGHIGTILGRGAASHTDPAILTSPARWPTFDRLLGALLERLAGITGDRDLPRTARLAFERHMLETTGESRQLSLIATAHVEVGAAVGDLLAAGNVERLRIAVTMEKDSIGTVELPVIEGRVRAAVVSDAIASAFAWPILGRLFWSTTYSSWTMRRDADGWSAWSGERMMCSGLPDDPAERAAALHDRAGWALFLEQSWHSSGRLEWWRRLVRGRFRRAGRASPAVVPIEVSAPIPHVPRGTRAVLLAGGALVVPIDAGALDGSRSGLQKVLVDAAGFELCRVVVREALIGSALSLTPLRDRLAKAAARRSAVRHRPVVAIQAGKRAHPLAPGAREALGLAASAGVAAVLARHDSPDAGSAASRFADLPASCEASVRRLADATGNSFFAISGTSRGAIAYDPGVSTVSEAAAPRALAMVPPAPVSTSRLPILMYHRIAPEAAPERKRYTVRPEDFEAQLEYLRDAGYLPASPDEWSAAVAARRPLAGRRIMLTFDDAYEDFGSTAWPLLQRYGFPAILFVVTGHVGKTSAWDPGGRDEPLLDWPALEDLVGKGVRIGSHTVSHPRLTSCAAPDMVEELARSRAELAERLGIAVDCVSYPWGGEDPVVQHFAAACGYATGFTRRTGTASAADAMLALPRLEVSADHSFGAFVRLFDS